MLDKSIINYGPLCFNNMSYIILEDKDMRSISVMHELFRFTKGMDNITKHYIRPFSRITPHIELGRLLAYRIFDNIIYSDGFSNLYYYNNLNILKFNNAINPIEQYSRITTNALNKTKKRRIK